MSGFQDLVFWQKSRVLVREIYTITADFPKSETFGLTAQIRRAAVSVSSNIAEGYGRQYRSDYVHFLNIARGSCYEVEAQLILCVDLGLLEKARAKPVFRLCQEIGKLLNATIQSLQNPDP